MDEELSLQSRLKRKIEGFDRKFSRKRKSRGSPYAFPQTDLKTWEAAEFLSNDVDSLGVIIGPLLKSNNQKVKSMKSGAETSLPADAVDEDVAPQEGTATKLSSAREKGKTWTQNEIDSLVSQLSSILNRVSDTNLDLTCSKLYKYFSEIRHDPLGFVHLRDIFCTVLCSARMGRTFENSVAMENPKGQHEGVSTFNCAALCAVLIYLHCTVDASFVNCFFVKVTERLQNVGASGRLDLQNLLDALTPLCHLFLGGMIEWEVVFELAKSSVLNSGNAVGLVGMLHVTKLCGLHLRNSFPEKFAAFEAQLRSICRNMHETTSCGCERSSHFREFHEGCTVYMIETVIADVVRESRSQELSAQSALEPVPEALLWVHAKLGSSFVYEKRIRANATISKRPEVCDDASKESLVTDGGILWENSSLTRRASSKGTSGATELLESKDRISSLLDRNRIWSATGRSVVEILASSVNFIEAASRIYKLLSRSSRSASLYQALEAILQCYLNEKKTNEFYGHLLIELCSFYGRKALSPLRQVLRNTCPTAERSVDTSVVAEPTKIEKRVRLLVTFLNSHGLSDEKLFRDPKPMNSRK
jgi:hypothetical protein